LTEGLFEEKALFYDECLVTCLVFWKSKGYSLRLNLLSKAIVGCLFHLYHARCSNFFQGLEVLCFSQDQIHLDSFSFLCPKLKLLEEGNDCYFVLAAFLSACF